LGDGVVDQLRDVLAGVGGHVTGLRAERLGTDAAGRAVQDAEAALTRYATEVFERAQP
jgi:hypothetical protein